MRVDARPQAGKSYEERKKKDEYIRESSAPKMHKGSNRGERRSSKQRIVSYLSGCIDEEE